MNKRRKKLDLRDLILKQVAAIIYAVKLYSSEPKWKTEIPKKLHPYIFVKKKKEGKEQESFEFHVSGSTGRDEQK